MPSRISPSSSTHRQTVSILLTSALLCALGTGCRQRAYTELYVENMAGEIRMLEDRVYEYDAAYQSLEQEIEDLRAINENLQRRTNASGGTSRGAPLRLKNSDECIEPYEILDADPSYESIQGEVHRESSTLNPPSKPSSGNDSAFPQVQRSPAAPPSASSKSSDKKSLLPAVPPKTPSEPDSKDASENLPIPNFPKPQSSPSPGENNLLNKKEPQASNSKPARGANSSLPSPDSLSEDVVMPPSMVRSANQPNLLTPPPANEPATPSAPEAPSKFPSLLQQKFPKILKGNTQGSLQEHRIRLPEGSGVRWASAIEPVQKPEELDTTIVDVAFHPTLSRGHNFDDKPGDDGLYLVVTPLNAQGQIINEVANLTIVVEDEALQDNKGRVAAWEFNADQLKETLEPIGTSQGFHLSLPWQNIQPQSQQVTVHLRYSMENGRTLINKRVLHLRKNSPGKSIWTPR